MLIKALREGDLAHSRLLRLPPRSGSLPDLKAIVCDGGFGCIIRDVEIKLHSHFRIETLDASIREVLREHVCAANESIAEGDFDSMVSFNSARIRHQCAQQEDWYRDVLSVGGVAQLRAILQAIPIGHRHQKVECCQDNYFDVDEDEGNTRLLDYIGLQRKLQSHAHPMAGDYMKQILTSLAPEILECNIVLPRLDECPDPILPAGSNQGTLSLQKVREIASDHLKFPALMSGENGHIINARAARQLGKFLSCAQNLQILQLHCDVYHLVQQDCYSDDEDATESPRWHLENRVWLNGILMHAKFPSLQELEISGAEFDVEHITAFLTDHETTLNWVYLDRFRLGAPNDLLPLVERLRSLSGLTGMAMTLKANLEELAMVADELTTVVENGSEPDRVINHVNNQHNRGAVRSLRCNDLI